MCDVETNFFQTSDGFYKALKPTSNNQLEWLEDLEILFPWKNKLFTKVY